MAERLQQSPLLTGDTLDIAFTITHNDHPEYGGLELSLRDLRRNEREIEGDPPKPAKRVSSAVR